MNQGENSLVDRIDPNLIPRPTPAIQLDPKLHPKLNELIMHCVEVDPDDRPDSMRYIVDRLNLLRGMLKAQAMQKPATKGPQDTRLGNDPGASSGGSRQGSSIAKLDPLSSGSTAVGLSVDQGR
jgi:serine/threonine protein kinase